MPLTKAQCPNCGGALEVDPSKEAAVCPFCNTPYIVEKAINNYTTNVTNNIQAETVIINGDQNLDFEIEQVTLVKYKGHEKNVVIPDYIERIEKEAFYHCSFIESVTFPEVLRHIGSYAFSGCSGLKAINLPDGLTEIGEFAFYECNQLQEIIIPNTVLYIDGCAFNSCEKVQKIIIPPELKKIKNGTFSRCEELTSIIIPETITEIGPGAFSDCRKLTDVQINTEKTKIMQYAFSRTPVEGKFSAYYNKLPADHSNNPLFQPPKAGGCYVATCVYGSYDCPQVWTLRRYRDNILAETWYGRAFIKTYYLISPTLVKLFGNTKWFKRMWQGKLDRMVAKLQNNGVESTSYEDKNW